MLNNLKIGVRLAIGFGFIVCLLAAISALSYNWLNTLNAELNNIVGDKFPKTVWANDIIDQVNVAARSTRNALLVKSKEEAKAELDRIPAASKITLIRKRSAQGLSDSARSTAAPLSTNPTVLATQANNPAQVTTNIMTAVALTDSKRT